MITALVSAICFWLNWGFALIFSAMLAKEMARQITNVDYRILVAAGYSGIAITQCGVGGSVLLTIAAQGGVANVCAYEGAIPLSTTVFNPATLIALAMALPSTITRDICMAKPSKPQKPAFQEYSIAMGPCPVASIATTKTTMDKITANRNASGKKRFMT